MQYNIFNDKAYYLTNIVYPSNTSVVYSYTNGQIRDISNVGSYDYDQLGALTKADTNSYGCDKVSNRTTENVNGSKTDYTIEGTSNPLLSSTFNSITSDPLGLAAGMNTYVYVNGNPINL